MRYLLPACCCAALMAGCAERPAPGPGRFAHAAVYRTIAPWDGAAVQLIFTESPVAGKLPAAPYVSVRINRGASQLANQAVRLAGKESREGHARWVPRDGASEPLASAVVTFGEAKEGEPVKGRYDLTFTDGRRERGSFEAAWLPPDGAGG